MNENETCDFCGCRGGSHLPACPVNTGQYKAWYEARSAYYAGETGKRPAGGLDDLIQTTAGLGWLMAIADDRRRPPK